MFLSERPFLLIGAFSGGSGTDTLALIRLYSIGQTMLPPALPLAAVAASSGGFTPPLVVLVVVFCLLFLLLALAVAYAKRDVSIDFTVLEIRR